MRGISRSFYSKSLLVISIYFTCDYLNMLKAFPNQDDFDSKYCLNPEKEFPNPTAFISSQGVKGN